VDCLLVFFPGAAKSPQSYKSLAESIQRTAAQCDISMHVGIASFFQNLPSLLGDIEFDDNLKAIFEIARDTNCTYSSVFIAGHSLGAMGGLKPALPYDGFIQLGSTMNSAGKMRWPRRSLSSYPKPVMTVVGDRDGFVRYLALSDELDNIDSRPQGGLTMSEVARRTPVIVIPNLNHMQVADNVVSSVALKTGRSDMQSDLSNEEAWKKIAEVVTGFVAMHAFRNRTVNDASNDDAWKSLVRVKSGYDIIDQESRQADILAHLENQATLTRSMLEPFRVLSSKEATGKFVAAAQSSLLNFKEGGAVRVASLWHETKEDFLYSKPTIQPDSGTIFIHLTEQPPLASSSMSVQLSPTIAVKMKSREALMAEWPESSFKSDGPVLTARDINNSTFEGVLKSVGEDDRRRYLTDGRQLRFEQDLVVSSAPAWVDIHIKLEFDKENRTVFFQSPVCSTPVDLMPRKFAGMFYGKFITPAQAYEWIMYDAFKDTAASGKKIEQLKKVLQGARNKLKKVKDKSSAEAYALEAEIASHEAELRGL
jgi:hypothetical protein